MAIAGVGRLKKLVRKRVQCIAWQFDQLHQLGGMCHRVGRGWCQVDRAPSQRLRATVSGTFSDPVMGLGTRSESVCDAAADWTRGQLGNLGPATVTFTGPVGSIRPLMARATVDLPDPLCAPRSQGVRPGGTRLVEITFPRPPRSPLAGL